MKNLITISALMFASTLTFSQTTVNIEPPTNDAYIYQGNPNNNYGSSPNLAVGYVGGSEMRMLIKWDLSSLPKYINITDAQIRLYQTTTNTSITADIERINGAWSELSVTWNNQPNTAGWYGSQTFSSTSGVKYIPATDLVNDWLTYGNNGVMFKINIGSSYQMFDSKEASGSDPRLIITYNSTLPTEEIMSINNLSVYPNPNTGKFVIEISKIENLEIKLLNILGQIIYNEKCFGKKIDIDLSEQKEGIYFLSIETDKGIVRKKIFIVW